MSYDPNRLERAQVRERHQRPRAATLGHDEEARRKRTSSSTPSAPRLQGREYAALEELVAGDNVERAEADLPDRREHDLDRTAELGEASDQHNVVRGQRRQLDVGQACHPPPRRSVPDLFRV